MASRYGIDKLRQPQIFQSTPDITGGDFGMGSYAPTYDDPFQPMPIPDEFQAINPGKPSFDPTSYGRNVQMGPPPQIKPMGQNAAYDPKEMADLINQFYTPSTVDRDRFRGLLDQYPEREEPSLGRRIVAAGAFLGNKSRGIPGGYEVQEKVLNAPHYRDMADFTAKAGPFSQAAQFENTANINERTLAGNVVNATTAANKQAELSRIADEKNRITEEKNRAAAEVNSVRARAYAAKNSGWTVEKAGSRFVAINPSTQERVDLGPSGGIDRADELDIIGEWGVKRSEAQGRAAVQTAQAGAVASGRDLVVINGTTYQRNEDGSFSPVQGLPQGTPTRPGTPPRPTAASGDMQKILGNAYAIDPEAREHIIKNDDGTYQMTDRPKAGPTGLWGLGAGVTQAQVDAWDRVRQSIDPNYVPPSLPRQEQTAPPPAPPTTSSKGIGPTKIPGTSEEEKTRADIRARAAAAGANKGAREKARITELEGFLANPKTPNQIRPAIQRELDDLKKIGLRQRAEEFLKAQGQVVTDKNVQLAIAKGYVK